MAKYNTEDNPQYEIVPKNNLNRNNDNNAFISGNDNLTVELQSILNQLKSQNGIDVSYSSDYKQLELKEHIASVMNGNENDFSANKRKTVLMDYDQEPKKTEEKLKAKIIEDLFASSRISKRSQNKNISELFDDKSSLMSSTKKKIIDDLFITDRSINTVFRKETDCVIGKKYIDPKLVIEEELMVNNKNDKENVNIVVNIHQQEPPMEIEPKESEDDDILDKVIEIKRNSLQNSLNIQNELKKNRLLKNTKDNSNDKEEIFKGVDSFEFSEKNNISSIRSNGSNTKRQVKMVNGEYNEDNEQEKDKINKAQNESNININEIEIKSKTNGVSNSIKPDIVNSNRSIPSIRQKEVLSSSKRSEQSSNRKPISQNNSSRVSNNSCYNNGNSQLNNSNQNKQNSILNKEKELNSQRSIQVSLSSFNLNNSKINSNSKRDSKSNMNNRADISQRNKESAHEKKAEVKTKVKLNQSNISDSSNKNMLDSRCINNNDNEDNDSHQQLPATKLFHKDNKVISNIYITPNTEIPFRLLKSTRMKDYEVPHTQFIQMRNAFVSNSYFASIISNKKNNEKSKRGLSNKRQQKVLLYNYPSIIYLNYEEVEDYYNQLYYLISIEEKQSLANTLLKPFRNKQYCQSRDNYLKSDVAHLYSKEAFINECNYKFSFSSKDFDYYRVFETDGNSFYHSFMFAYIEQLLISRKKKKLLSLFLDILRLNDYNDVIYKDINLKQSMTFLSLMSDYIQCNLFTDAYLLFIASYVNEEIESMKYLLLIYVKFCLFTMLYEEIRVTNNKKKRNPKWKSKHKDKNDNLNINEDVINDELILSNILKSQMEPCDIVFTMLPFICGVKLKIYYLEGEIDSAQIDVVEYNYNTNEKEMNANDGNDITISLGYFYSGYNCVYSKSLYDSNDIFKQVNEPNIIKESSSLNLNISNNNNNCSQCENCMKLVNFNQYKIAFCNDCLIKCINTALIQRAKSFATESYLNLECKHILIKIHIDYSRMICINNDPIIQLTNSNVLILYKESISVLLSKIIQSLCFNCFNPFSKDNQSYSLSCSCQLCHLCIFDFIKRASNDYIILNRYEIETQEKIKCACKGEFNYCDAIKMLRGSFDNEYTQAINRMNDIVSTKCMKCLETLLKESNRILVQSTSTKKVYQQIKIHKVNSLKIIKGIDYSDNEHLICMKCYKRIDIDLNESLKIGQSQDQSLNNTIERIEKQGRNGKGISCNICNTEHIVDKKDWEGMKRNTCCDNKCFIY